MAVLEQYRPDQIVRLTRAGGIGRVVGGSGRSSAADHRSRPALLALPWLFYKNDMPDSRKGQQKKRLLVSERSG